MSLEELLAWWNVIYLLPFGLALLYLFAYSASGWTFGEIDTDFDADADVDADADLGADVDVDGDLPAEAGVEAEADAGQDLQQASHPPTHTPAADIDADTDPTGTKGLLNAVAWLGVGRVPLSILLMVLFLTFGSIGFVINQLAREWTSPHLVWLISLPVALAGSLGLTSVTARAIARWLPMTESSARHRRELVGSRATTVFAVNDQEGVAVVRDPGGDRYQVACRTLPGRAPIAGGTEVVLVKYKADLGIFYAVPSGLVEGLRRLDGEPVGDAA